MIPCKPYATSTIIDPSFIINLNAVGVDVNTVSEALLSYVAAFNNTHAENIIE
ncbi:MAG: hypothetical protein GKC53_03105 [Neisseriaceae bacterium]|nr:MAG: hypothetical protein GKC53_03105 [Neisseriaceae bacterium]